jgi:hypothetical protein
VPDSDRSTSAAPLVLTIGAAPEALCRKAGCVHVQDATHPEHLLDRHGKVRSELAFFGTYVILIPPGGEALRDRIAIALGDEHCRWAYLPDDPVDIRNAIVSASPMWSDEVSTIDDIPEPGPEVLYKSGFPELDQHGFRITLPAFMPIIGPYGSGKSVLLRQLLMNLWRLHRWKFLLTSFEERVKPRYVRDLRRHIIRKPYVDLNGVVQWSDVEIARADAEIRQAAVFLRRKRGVPLDAERLLNRIEYAVRVHGVKVVAIDPINEVDMVVPKGESKTDYMGRLIMALKALADDYGLLVIVCAHPPKDGVEKRKARAKLLTLNDGADTAHWGNKADIGFCVWRPGLGEREPTYLHLDKTKDHETMGSPTLAELVLNPITNSFRINRMGYGLLQEEDHEE